jgi:hypothetical protein
MATPIKGLYNNFPSTSKTPAPAPQASPSSDGQAGAPKSIQDDPKAVECIEYLKSAGYTPDDVADAMATPDDMGSDSDTDTGSDMDSGSAATQAAPMSIPGMR